MINSKQFYFIIKYPKLKTNMGCTESKKKTKSPAKPSDNNINDAPKQKAPDIKTPAKDLISVHIRHLITEE